jgi:predicted nuclease of predicted toxin-antitoxin system
MNLPPELGRKLETAGHEWRHVADIGMARAADSAILARAKLDNECVLTHDLDCGQLLAFSGDSSPSVVIFRLRRVDIDLMFRRLSEERSEIERAVNTGAIVTIEESARRIRPLPIVKT